MNATDKYAAAGIPAPQAAVLRAHATTLAAAYAASQGGPAPISIDQLLHAAATFARFVMDGGASS